MSSHKCINPFLLSNYSFNKRVNLFYCISDNFIGWLSNSYMEFCV